MSADSIIVALAGQPNCGKSTVFNALTGASQHVANYPGVTVEKMVGWSKANGRKMEIVDLPGTYSLTSYSPEEQVARDFILHDKPSVVVNVMDASNLNRCLYLTFQLLEMEMPLVLNLNMMDVAERNGLRIDTEKLARRLGIRVTPSSMKNGRGKQELLDSIAAVADAAGSRGNLPRIDYGPMEVFLREIEEKIKAETSLSGEYPRRWLAIKLMEADREVQSLIREHHADPDGFLSFVDVKRTEFERENGLTTEMHIANRRYQAAADIGKSCSESEKENKITVSDRIDRLVCHRLAGPLILVGVIWILYYLSIVQGYNLTNYTWPLLAKLRSLAESVLPAPGFIDIPLLRSFVLWFVDSINALLNYIPIFFILFSLIAILEDSGYMPRMAFIMDRLLSRYGLHGQSTLPMVLGGIYVGGCAVPGVMSCKGIPDARSRLATILIIPLLNCLAKVPLYVLLINIYFAAHKGLAMFFISTISLLMVLPVAKALTMTVLRRMETAPFVMEMPPYHLPTFRGVLGRAVERVWLFIRKITTIVAAVAVVIFALLQFPGLGAERQGHYQALADKALAEFHAQIEATTYAGPLQGDGVTDLINYWDGYKTEKSQAGGQDKAAAVDEEFKGINPVFFSIVNAEGGPEAKKVNRAVKKLDRARRMLLLDMRKERIDRSFLGRMGQALEPVTRWAGFNWRVNVALLSALAAKESSVATLGALYEPEEGGEALEERMARTEEGFTPLHALALMLFMVLYPPCIATAVAVKLQSGSVRWMLFSMAYPMVLGLSVATLVYSGGAALGLTGLQAMFAFYGLALALTIVMGLVGNKSDFA